MFDKKKNIISKNDKSILIRITKIYYKFKRHFIKKLKIL